jgi:hypothetical protein
MTYVALNFKGILTGLEKGAARSRRHPPSSNEYYKNLFPKSKAVPSSRTRQT